MIGGRFITTPWFGPTISCGRKMLNAQPSGRRLLADVVLLQPVEVLVLVAGKRSRAGIGIGCRWMP